MWLAASVGSYMCSGFMFLYSPCDNLPSVLTIDYNSIQQPVLVVFLSLYNYYYLLYLVLPHSSLVPHYTLNLAPCLSGVLPVPSEPVP